jgi:hypothetical protein
MLGDKYSETGSIACYRNWFLQEHDGLRARVLFSGIFQPAPWVSALSRPTRRTDDECHEIACWIDGALAARYTTAQRHDAGDPDLWITIQKDPDVVAQTPPCAPSAIECLTVMWLWKATALESVMTVYGAAWPALLADEPEAVSAKALASIESCRREDIRLLTFEATRAGSLADALEASNAQLKEAAREGGRARARRFEALKQRVLELYPQTAARSRDQSAEQICQLLAAEGWSVKFRTVRDYLKRYDDEIERRRRGAAS